jgi:hypothetical protein
MPWMFAGIAVAEAVAVPSCLKERRGGLRVGAAEEQVPVVVPGGSAAGHAGRSATPLASVDHEVSAAVVAG